MFKFLKEITFGLKEKIILGLVIVITLIGSHTLVYFQGYDNGKDSVKTEIVIEKQKKDEKDEKTTKKIRKLASSDLDAILRNWLQ
jgi:cell division protein FtsL